MSWFWRHALYHYLSFGTYMSERVVLVMSILNSQQRVNSVRLNWISQPFGIMAIGIAKASVACQILRFQSPNKWRTRVLYFIAWSITLLSVFNCILTFVQCNPPRALWTPELAAIGKCWPPQIFTDYVITQSSMSSVCISLFGYAYMLISPGYDAALDFILVFISTTIIWNLKLSVARRIQLAALLDTGVL